MKASTVEPLHASRPGDTRRRAATATIDARPLIVVQLRMALTCLLLTILGGALGVLHYVPELSPGLHEMGLGFNKLRPLHTTLASLWIYGAAVAVIYHWLGHHGQGLRRGDVRRFWFHTACWLAAGVGIVVTLLAGVFTGREYLGAHPAFSALLLAGWIAFAVTLLKRTLPGFWQAPVYVWFWTVGALYFVYTFVEGHAYLLPAVQETPTRDIALHWKSCGTLVGSFNFLVYGSLAYVAERLSGDRRYAQSATAFALFGVGCLNSFTNFAHHTYHLPQSEAVKWIAFVVSMAEVAILWKLLVDVGRMLRKRGGGAFDATTGYLASARVWTAVMLAIAIVISVPSWNSLIHGTLVVTGHAMGTELGIDSMVLFGGIAFLLGEVYRGQAWAKGHVSAPRMRVHLVAMNGAMALLVTWLTLAGLAHGLNRYEGLPSPEWVGLGKYVFPAAGGLLALSLLYLVGRWAPLLLRVERRTEVGAAAAAAPMPTDGEGK